MDMVDIETGKGGLRMQVGLRRQAVGTEEVGQVGLRRQAGGTEEVGQVGLRRQAGGTEEVDQVGPQEAGRWD